MKINLVSTIVILISILGCSAQKTFLPKENQVIFIDKQESWQIKEKDVKKVHGEDTYTDVNEAILALSIHKNSLPWSAIKYLSKHSEEAAPHLMQMVEKQSPGWISANAALTQSKDNRFVPFYIGLLQNNYFEKEADGTRRQYGLGTKNGCTRWPFLYGGVLARALGEFGDPKAIPVLKEAAIQGDSVVRKNAYKALYKLGALSLDDLFEMVKAKSDTEVNIPDIILSIGGANIHSDTRSALNVFDRVINELPGYQYEIASAHFWKVQCFEILNQYNNAIQECDEVMKFPQYENLINQIKEKRKVLTVLSEETHK